MGDNLQRAQLGCADIVVLNKVDLVDAPGRIAAVARLGELCPHARILPCSYGNVSLADILEVSEMGSADLTAAVSHEASQTAWVVDQNMEPKTRPSTGNADVL